MRALWRGLLKSRSNAALAALRPIIVIKEGNNGLGMQLRLVAGPLERCRGGGENLRRHGRKQAALRDHGVRRPAPCDEADELGCRARSGAPSLIRQACREPGPSGSAGGSLAKRVMTEEPPKPRTHAHAVVVLQQAADKPINQRNYNALRPNSRCLCTSDAMATAAGLSRRAFPIIFGPMKKTPFRLTPYQVQWLMVVGFVTVGYALYLRYLAIEFSHGVAGLRCRPADHAVQDPRCWRPTLFKQFGVRRRSRSSSRSLHLIRPSIVLLTGGLIAAGFGIVLYNVGLSGLAIGLLILGFARPAPATA